MNKFVYMLTVLVTNTLSDQFHTIRKLIIFAASVIASIPHTYGLSLIGRTCYLVNHLGPYIPVALIAPLVIHMTKRIHIIVQMEIVNVKHAGLPSIANNERND